MSEAELHILKARMLAGRKAKARRGELGKPVPIGYARRPSGEVVLDPDEQAQATVRLIFDLFDRFRTVGKVSRGAKASWPAVIADLDSLTETEVEQDGKRFLLRSSPRPGASFALSALGVALPPTLRQVVDA